MSCDAKSCQILCCCQLQAIACPEGTLCPAEASTAFTAIAGLAPGSSKAAEHSQQQAPDLVVR